MSASNEHPAPLRRGGDARKNWETINQINDLLQPIASEVRRLGSAIADLRMRPTVKEGGGGTSLLKMRVTEEKPNFLTCFDTTTQQFKSVAKPPHLRETLWVDEQLGDWVYTKGNATATVQTSRIATYQGGNVSGGIQFGDRLTEVVNLPYVINDPEELGYIYILTSPLGTGVFELDGITPILLMDINAADRRWVASRTRVEMCRDVAGTTRQYKIVLDGGPAEEK